MGRYKIAGCIVDYNPKYDLLKKQIEPYCYQGNEPTTFKLIMSEQFCHDKQKENPHLTLAQCEYIFAGSQFYRILLKHGAFMLHASAVEVYGKAYLFSASSGTGKSTHTKLWQEYFGLDRALIINDDKPVLKIEDGICVTYGTPFSGKSDKNLNRRVPVQGICMLERGKENKIWLISAKEALSLIMQQTILPHDELLVNNLLTMLDQVLKQVPIYRMQCNISTEAAIMAYEKMKGEISNED